MRNFRKNLKIFVLGLFFLSFSFVLVFFLLKFGIPVTVGFTSLVIGHSRPSGNIQIEFVPPPEIFSDYESTNSAEILITGKSFVSGQVKIFLNDSEVKKIDTGTGDLFTTEIIINEGQNKIFAVSQSTINQVSSSSNILSVVYDKSQPSLEISSPENNAKFSGQKQKDITVEGKTEEGNRILINDRPAIIKRGGYFSLRYELTEGENHLKIIAINDAGNQVEKEITLFFNP